MRSKTQGLLAHLLMFLPLLAVPFIASFGVPWLAAKAKEEGVAVPDIENPALPSTGVGESNTARRSADDLFAPILQEAEVDLQLAPAAPSPLPHLRNASLVISNDEAWVDPFQKVAASSASPPGSPSSPKVDREEALGDWTLKTEPAEFGPPETPSNADFPAEHFENPPPPAKNPFAVLERAEEEPSQVDVEENAFEDPAPPPRIAPEAEDFDAGRTLFAQANLPSERPPVREPEIPEPAEVEADPPADEQETPPPLTWDLARQRLKSLDIKEYYLQPDPESGMFLFRCAYARPETPRVSRLFEAEAPDPLQAVEEVLEQVESWRNQSAHAH